MTREKLRDPVELSVGVSTDRPVEDDARHLKILGCCADPLDAE